LYFRQNGGIWAVPQLSGAFPGQLRALADIAIQANEAHRKPSPEQLADQSKHWLDDWPMAVNEYKDRLAAEFSIGIKLADRTSTQLARLEGYAKWQEGGNWWIGLESDHPRNSAA